MFDIIKRVITRGGFDLANILSKIDTLWTEGKIGDDQREELTVLARGSAAVTDSIDITAKLLELELRIKALESNNNEDTLTTSEYEVGKWYYTGDTCLFEGVEYVCTAPEGTVCVWSPSEFPAYWEAYNI